MEIQISSKMGQKNIPGVPQQFSGGLRLPVRVLRDGEHRVQEAGVGCDIGVGVGVYLCSHFCLSFYGDSGRETERWQKLNRIAL